jgi:NDP-sugar pyrophosphorylase family protein
VKSNISRYWRAYLDERVFETDFKVSYDDTFYFTYGDGLSKVDIEKLVSCHRKQNSHSIVTAERFIL